MTSKTAHMEFISDSVCEYKKKQKISKLHVCGPGYLKEPCHLPYNSDNIYLFKSFVKS